MGLKKEAPREGIEPSWPESKSGALTDYATWVSESGTPARIRTGDKRGKVACARPLHYGSEKFSLGEPVGFEPTLRHSQCRVLTITRWLSS